MPTENVSNRNGQNPYFVDYWKVRNWQSSERIGGKLRLRNNPYQFLSGNYGTRKYPRGYHTWLPATPPSGGDVPPAVHQQYALQALEAKCYNSLRGKLYKGSAALGVTFGSMAQSRAMVAARFNTLRRMGADVVAEISSVQRRHGLWGTKTLETVANAHLEVIFGWTPLLADIYASCTTVIQIADKYEFIETSHKADGSVKVGFDQYATTSRVSYSTGVRLSNPNRWLAERAGLLNPVTVAWDLVPWSFVVNMFVNTGQMFQQITDFAGLTFFDTYATRTMQYRCARAMSAGSVNVLGFWQGYDKRRAIAAFPTPPGLTLRLPSVDWKTAAMAGSLFIQQFSKVSKLIAPYEHTFRRARRGPPTD